MSHPLNQPVELVVVLDAEVDREGPADPAHQAVPEGRLGQLADVSLQLVVGDVRPAANLDGGDLSGCDLLVKGRSAHASEHFAGLGDRVQ